MSRIMALAELPGKVPGHRSWIRIMIAVAVLGLGSSALARGRPLWAAVGEPAADAAVAALLERLSGGPEVGTFFLLLGLVPALLMALTSFGRIYVVLSLLRQGLGLNGLPPGPVLILLSACLSFFSMRGVLQEVETRAVRPWLEHRLDGRRATEAALPPLKEFMLRQTRTADLELFLRLSGGQRPRGPQDVPLSVAVPGFLLSEIKTALFLGILVLLPLVLVDLVVAVVQSALGLTLSANVGLVLKLALFHSVDGWNLVASSLVQSFR